MIREQNHHSLKRENCSCRNSPPESTLFLRTEVQVLKQNSSESHWTCLTCNNSFFIMIIIIFSRTSLMQTIVFFIVTIFCSIPLIKIDGATIKRFSTLKSSIVLLILIASQQIFRLERIILQLFYLLKSSSTKIFKYCSIANLVKMLIYTKGPSKF